MSATEPSSEPKKPRSLASYLVLPLLLIAVGVGLYRYLQTAEPAAPPLDTSKILNGYVKDAERFSKLNYPDADGDLVADLVADAREPAELLFMEIPTSNVEEVEKIWTPFLAHMSAATGKPCKYLRVIDRPSSPAPAKADTDADDKTGKGDQVPEGGLTIRTFDTQLTALREGYLHITAFTTGQVPIAVNTAGFVPMVAPADKDNRFYYRFEVLVGANSPIKSVSELKGGVLGVSALSSTSSAKAPFVVFYDEFKLHPRRDYQIRLPGDYRQTLGELTSNKITAMCIASDLLAREVAAKRISPDQYKSIYQSKEFPKLCFGASHQLPPSLIEKIRTGFTTFQFEGNSVGEKYRADGAVKFHPINYKSDWEVVRQVDARLVEILKQD
jgi:phosphonate transport system substrate-binding protein